MSVSLKTFEFCLEEDGEITWSIFLKHKAEGLEQPISYEDKLILNIWIDVKLSVYLAVNLYSFMGNDEKWENERRKP